jgi:hypothetical protein
MGSETRAGLPKTMPQKPDDVMVAEFDTELVVLVPGARMAHHLDEGLSLVLDSCDGSTPTAAVIAEVADATGDSNETVEEWLRRTLDQLEALDMVTLMT